MYDASTKQLIGKTVKHIFLNEEYLKFVTDGGNFVFTVEGDCCSHSYFYDFIGVKKLLAGNPITSFESVELSEDDPRAKVKPDEYEEIECYGYRITTEDPKFGEVSSVFSFRNSSNGYYGGWMRDTSPNTSVEPEITDDVLEVEASNE